MNQTEAQLTYSVPGVSCGHCRAAITAEVAMVPGVDSVDVDLDARRVTVVGRELVGSVLEDEAVRDDIDEAGYVFALAEPPSPTAHLDPS